MLEYAGAINQESKTRTDGKTIGLGASSMRWDTKVEIFVKQLNVHSTVIHYPISFSWENNVYPSI